MKKRMDIYVARDQLLYALYSESLTMPKCDITRRQKTNGGSRIVYITEKLAHQHAQNMTFGLFVTGSQPACSG